LKRRKVGRRLGWKEERVERKREEREKERKEG
jgi:hypothetical protein